MVTIKVFNNHLCLQDKFKFRIKYKITKFYYKEKKNYKITKFKNKNFFHLSMKSIMLT